MQQWLKHSLIALGALVLIVSAALIIRALKNRESFGDDPLPFKKLVLNIHGSMASADEFELISTDGGVVFSHYNGWWDSSDESKSSRESFLKKRIVGDAALYDELASLLGKCGARSWDGFSESDPRVLDGYSFSLEIELEDGKSISARGSNAYPSNYHVLRSRLYELAAMDNGE